MTSPTDFAVNKKCGKSQLGLLCKNLIYENCGFNICHKCYEFCENTSIMNQHLKSSHPSEYSTFEIKNEKITP